MSGLEEDNSGQKKEVKSSDSNSNNNVKEKKEIGTAGNKAMEKMRSAMKKIKTVILLKKGGRADVCSVSFFF